MMEEIKKYILKNRGKRLRIRTIFLGIRKLEKFSGFSDLVLLNTIVSSLIDLNLPYSKKEVYSAFREVNKSDYDKSQKRELLKNLLKKAREKSPFEASKSSNNVG